MSKPSGKTIGIDLGTTFSAVAQVNALGMTEIITNDRSERITPSVILFDGPENVIVGSVARQSAIAEPERIVEFVKREMGKGVDEYHREFFGKKYSAETLSALILKKLKQDAENAIGTAIEDAVITVPAYFDDRQRNATKSAGKIAGLNVLQVLNEPMAAALAFGVNKLGKDQNVFVFDLGGGTFDVTVLRIEGDTIREIATAGNHRLGGKDWDDAIVNYASERFMEQYGRDKDPQDDPQVYQELYTRVVDAKIALSLLPKTKIVCSYLGNSLKLELTREKFEELTKNLVGQCRTLSELVLEQDAKLKWSDIDTVLLVGGATRMPMIKEMLKTLTGRQTMGQEVNPDEAVALGAAIQANQLGDEPTPMRNDAGKKIGPIQIRNVSTHTLGITAYDSDRKLKVFPIIPHFTLVPCKVADDSFITVDDDQRSLQADIMEGESSIPDECRKVGELIISDLPPGLPKGTKVGVTFEYDSSAILHAEMRAAGKEGKAQIKVEGGLTEEEVKEESKYAQKITVA